MTKLGSIPVQKKPIAKGRNRKALLVLASFVLVLLLVAIFNQPHAYTLVLLLDNSGSTATQVETSKKASGQLLLNESGSNVQVYAFSNEVSEARLNHAFDGNSEEPEVLMKRVEAVLNGPKSQAQGTYYSTPLRQLINLCRQSSVPVYACMISDGGVNYEDWHPTTQACEQLAKEPHFGGLLIMPVQNGQLSQILERTVMQPLGGKLLIGHDPDFADTIRKFREWEEGNK